MELINYNYNLESDDWQPIVSFSASKNSFIVLTKLIKMDKPREGNDSENKGTESNHNIFVGAIFRLYHVNNDLNYNIIRNLKFDPTGSTDAHGKPSFYVCLDIKNKPDYSDHQIDFDKPIVLNHGDEFRVHLDYSDDCGGGPVNSGSWPCNFVTTI